MTEKTSILDPKKWVEIYADELFGYARSKTGNSSLSEDLVQDTFLGALKSQANFKGNSSERTWLFSILKFKIADHYRKASTKNEIWIHKLTQRPNLLGTSATCRPSTSQKMEFTPQQ